MATQTVTVARIYLREGEHLLAKLIKLLHDEEKVSGVTVLRGMRRARELGEKYQHRLQFKGVILNIKT